MAFETPSDERHVPQIRRKRHQQIMAEGSTGERPPAVPDPPSHSRQPKKVIDLTGDKIHQSGKRDHGDRSHSETPSKRVKPQQDTYTIARTFDDHNASSTPESMYSNAGFPSRSLGDERNKQNSDKNSGELIDESCTQTSSRTDSTTDPGSEEKYVNTLKKMLNTRSGNVQEMQQQIEGLKAATEKRIRAEISANTDELQVVNGYLEKSRQENENFSQALIAANTTAENLQHELNTTEHNLSKDQEAVASFKTTLNKANEDLESAQEECRRLQTLSQNLNGTNEHWALKFAAWAEERKRHKKTAANLKKDWTTSKKNLTTAKKDLAAAEKKLQTDATGPLSSPSTPQISGKTDIRDAEHNAQIDELELKNSELKMQNEDLQADFMKQVEELTERKKELLQQLEESHGLSQRYNFKVSDQEIIEHFGELKQKIEQFAHRHTRPLPGLLGHKLDTGVWTTLSPDAVQFLSSPMLSSYAFEAYIWELLRRFVFLSGSTLWAGDLGGIFDELLTGAGSRIRGNANDLTVEYHSWRATSSNLLSRLSQRGFNSEIYQERVGNWIHNFQILLGPTFDAQAATQDILIIVNDARDFEIMRRKLKSNVTICFEVGNDNGNKGRYSMPVDGAVMRQLFPKVEVDAPNYVPTVELIVSPRIMRCGNGNGTDYDRKTCLVKGDVLFSQAPEVSHPQVADSQMPALGGQPEQMHHDGLQGAIEQPLIKTEPTDQTAVHWMPQIPDQPVQMAQSSAENVHQASNRPQRTAGKNGRHQLVQSLETQRMQEEEDELTGYPEDYDYEVDSPPSKLEK